MQQLIDYLKNRVAEPIEYYNESTYIYSTSRRKAIQDILDKIKEIYGKE